MQTSPAPRRPSRASLSLLVALAAAGCVLEVGPGPDLGTCAEPPEGTYTYGQIGIGTCLAGPTDLRFIQRDGRTYLLVSNADPFSLFTTGSLSVLDLTDADQLDRVVGVDELEAAALPIDGYPGGLAYSDDQQLAVVADRASNDSLTTLADDRVWLVDLSDPLAPRYLDERVFLGVRQDPFAISFDPAQQRAFVVNQAAHSLSVVDLASSPPTLLDPAPAPLITPPVFDDADGSGSRADARITATNETELFTTDAWDLTWIEGTWRLWVMEDDGLQRWTSSGLDAVRIGLDLDLDPALTGLPDHTDPFVARFDNQLIAYFSDGDEIRWATTSDGVADWGAAESLGITGYESWADGVGGPCVATVDARNLLYVDGGDTPGSGIGVGFTSDGLTYTSGADALLTPGPGFERLAQPHVRIDPQTDAPRMWMSRFDGATWSLAVADSDDGLAWSEPRALTGFEAYDDAAAPHVTWTGGRYVMWLTVSDGTGWSHARATSYDGVHWFDVTLLVDSDEPLSAPRPPRVAIQPDLTEGWRAEGVDEGALLQLTFAGAALEDLGRGLRLSAAGGHLLAGAALPGDTDDGVEPGSVVTVDGVRHLYVTAHDTEGVPRLAVYVEGPDGWEPAADDLIPTASGGNVAGARDPVVFDDGDAWVMLYAAEAGDDTTGLRVATSDDGLAFTPVAGEQLADVGSWASVARRPHAVEPLDGGGWRLWFSGFDGGTWRIGTATSDDGRTFTLEPGPLEAWQLETGEPGTFDDTSVRDPFPVRTAEGLQLWYAGFDGEVWSVGVATRPDDDAPFERRLRPTADVPLPALDLVARTYAAVGVTHPVIHTDDEGETVLLHAGFDGERFRIGEALVRGTDAFPAHRVPTDGDRFTFSTRRGEPGRSEIPLGQTLQGVTLPGSGGNLLSTGPTGSALDVDRGLMYVVSPGFDGMWVVDVRDDSTETFLDRNHLDLEAALQFDTTTGLLGFHDVALGPDGLVYLASREPEGILVVDTSGIVDNGTKELIRDGALGILPLRDQTDDAGAETFASAGPLGLAYVPGAELLLATHYRDNSLSVFDLTNGPLGEEIRYLPELGENPTTVRLSPDGRYAVIALYLGDVDEGETRSSLALLDLDPASPTYLQIRTRIVNR